MLMASLIAGSLSSNSFMGDFLEYLLITWLGLRALQVLVNFLRIAVSNTIGKLFGVDAALGTVGGAPVWFIIKPEMVAHFLTAALGVMAADDRRWPLMIANCVPHQVAHFLTAALGVSGWFVRSTENAEIDALQGVHADGH